MNEFLPLVNGKPQFNAEEGRGRVNHGGEFGGHGGEEKMRRERSFLGRFSFFYDYYDNLPKTILPLFLFPSV